MTVEDAIAFFAGLDSRKRGHVVASLRLLAEAGLGYLRSASR